MTRFSWPTPNEQYLRKIITEGGLGSADGQIERLRYVWEEFGPPSQMLLIGGIQSMFALNELKLSFIVGNYMATILLAQAFIEHSLGGAYSMSGDDQVANSGLARLVARAKKDGILGPHLADSFDNLRKMRNPYTHHIGGDGPRTYMSRLSESSHRVPEDLAEEDAKISIQIVVDYLRDGSPDWNPANVNWTEEG